VWGWQDVGLAHDWTLQLFLVWPLIAGIGCILGALLATGRVRALITLACGLSLFGIGAISSETREKVSDVVSFMGGDVLAFLTIVIGLSVTLAFARAYLVIPHAKLARYGGAATAVVAAGGFFIPGVFGTAIGRMTMFDAVEALSAIAILTGCFLALLNAFLPRARVGLCRATIALILIGMFLPIASFAAEKIERIGTVVKITCFLFAPFLALAVGLAGLLEHRYVERGTWAPAAPRPAAELEPDPVFEVVLDDAQAAPTESSEPASDEVR
jgi:hypothetical protein